MYPFKFKIFLKNIVCFLYKCSIYFYWIYFYEFETVSYFIFYFQNHKWFLYIYLIFKNLAKSIYWLIFYLCMYKITSYTFVYLADIFPASAIITFHPFLFPFVIKAFKNINFLPRVVWATTNILYIEFLLSSCF